MLGASVRYQVLLEVLEPQHGRGWVPAFLEPASQGTEPPRNTSVWRTCCCVCNARPVAPGSPGCCGSGLGLPWRLPFGGCTSCAQVGFRPQLLMASPVTQLKRLRNVTRDVTVAVFCWRHGAVWGRQGAGHAASGSSEKVRSEPDVGGAGLAQGGPARLADSWVPEKLQYILFKDGHPVVLVFGEESVIPAGPGMPWLFRVDQEPPHSFSPACRATRGHVVGSGPHTRPTLLLFTGCVAFVVPELYGALLYGSSCCPVGPV
ncbi:hypothetical protein CB1_000977009 [Camelus ferus]|nr:hypothetical protein CB1_000977009 [Camelus ferus]